MRPLGAQASQGRRIELRKGRLSLAGVGSPTELADKRVAGSLR